MSQENVATKRMPR